MTHQPAKSPRLCLGAALLGLIAAAAVTPVAARAQEADQDTGIVIPAPRLDEKPGTGPRTLVLAGGCFWGVQGVYEHVKGVTRAVAGYTGGKRGTAIYQVVARGDSGHAESVEIVYDPGQVTMGRLLQIFYAVVHDPTTLDYQEYDSGPQYRSAIFPRNAEQAALAKAYIDQLDRAHVFKSPIVTSIEAGRTFYRAEDYHQNFVARDPSFPYVAVNDLPKIAALKHLFPDLYRERPVLEKITTKVMTP
jgi:peptide-methionine (S)-S-oxide reductase